MNDDRIFRLLKEGKAIVEEQQREIEKRDEALRVLEDALAHIARDPGLMGAIARKALEEFEEEK